MIRILFFGPIAELAGVRSVEVEFCPGMTLGALRADLSIRYPQAIAAVALCAIDGVQVRDPERALADGNEVAFMTKFSGG